MDFCLILRVYISESILSMDIPSTGPTSLRSNYTDDTNEDDEDDEDTTEDKSEDAPKPDNEEEEGPGGDRFAKLISHEELSQARLILIQEDLK